MKKMMMVGIAALLIPAAFASANLLSNPSFELDEDLSGSPDDWSFWGYDADGANGAPYWSYHADDAANAYDGNAWVEVIEWATGHDLGMLYQNGIPGEGGVEYAGEFMIAHSWGWGVSAFTKMEFYDAGGTKISEATDYTWISNEVAGYVSFPYSAVAPEGTATMVAAFGVWTDSETNGAPGNGFAFKVDGASLVAVPEPASIALLGLGGLALIRRR